MAKELVDIAASLRHETESAYLYLMVAQKLKKVIQRQAKLELGFQSLRLKIM